MYKALPNVLKAVLLLLVFAGINSYSAEAQVILQYNWDVSTDVRIPVIGPGSPPTGYTVNGFATTASPGTSAPNGVRPGYTSSGFPCSFIPSPQCDNSCRQDVDLGVPASGGYFDHDEMTFSIDYRKVTSGCGGAESEFKWFSRGAPTYFFFGVSGHRITYKYRVKNGGSYYDIPDACSAGSQRQCWGCDSVICTSTPCNGIIDTDGIWRTYTFKYNQTLGAAQIYVDGNLLYTEACAYPGNALWWDATDTYLNIGEDLDGEGNLVSQLDNAEVEIPGVLPVELTSFSGEIEGMNALLNWETSFETNNDYFTLERSVDGYTFEEIARIAGVGNSQSATSYSFVDQDPQKGTNIYRLAQTDLNGNMRYLNSLELLFDHNQSGLIAIYPNPVKGTRLLTLLFNSEITSNGKILVTDLYGRIMIEQSISLQSGSNKIELNTQYLTKGIYFVKLFSKGVAYTDRFLKTD